MSQPSDPIEARPVSDDDIAALLNDLGRSPLGIGTDREFRISIAGAQEKTALLFWNNTWHIPHGTTATTHILKPQIGRLPNGIDLSESVENEYLCMKMIAALDMPVAPVEMAEFSGKRALVVERFDRLWTKDHRLLRLPQEDCCQALSVPPNLKYESDGGPGVRDIAALLKGSDEPETDLRLFFKAQLVFWLLGATDGHAKNFSLRLSPGGRFRLAPLYDVMSAQPNADAGEIQRKQMRMAMALGRQRHYIVDFIVLRHFEQTAALSGYSLAALHDIVDELKSTFVPAIDKTIAHLPNNFPDAVATSIAHAAKRRLEMLNVSEAGAATES